MTSNFDYFFCSIHVFPSIEIVRSSDGHFDFVIRQKDYWPNQVVSLVVAFEKWPTMVLEWFLNHINIQTRPANLPTVLAGATAEIGDQVDGPIAIDCKSHLLYFSLMSVILQITDMFYLFRLHKHTWVAEFLVPLAARWKICHFQRSYSELATIDARIFRVKHLFRKSNGCGNVRIPEERSSASSSLFCRSANG